MKSRFIFVLIASFWVVMNVLLWRAEFSGRSDLGASVPPELVWQKILTAPDYSTLEIFRGKERLGVCRWMVNIGEERKPVTSNSNNTELEGQVRKITGYALDLDGNVILKEFNNTARLSLHANFSTNHTWQNVELQINLRPTTVAIRADANQQQLAFKITDENGTFEKTYSFTDLQRPEILLQDFELPAPIVLLAAAGLPVQAGNGSLTNLSLGLQWTAAHDTLKIGKSGLRVYRIQAHLLDRYEIAVFTSRVGEILRVELPGGITLVNTALSF